MTFGEYGEIWRKAKEPVDPSPEHPDKNWSLINVINQKNLRPQDRPRPVTGLDREAKDLITGYYPEIVV